MTATILQFPAKRLRDRKPSDSGQPVNATTAPSSNGFNGRTPRQEWVRQVARELIVERMKSPRP